MVILGICINVYVKFQEGNSWVKPARKYHRTIQSPKWLVPAAIDFSCLEKNGTDITNKHGFTLTSSYYYHHFFLRLPGLLTFRRYGFCRGIPQNTRRKQTKALHWLIVGGRSILPWAFLFTWTETWQTKKHTIWGWQVVKLWRRLTTTQNLGPRIC